MTLNELFPTELDRNFLYTAFTPPIVIRFEGSFGDWWFKFFRDREVITTDRDKFYRYVRQIHPIIADKWFKLVVDYPNMLDDLIKATDERTLTNYAAPNGTPDTAYSTGMIKEVFSETSTDEDYARLTRVKEIRNFYYDMLSEYECLFVGVWAI